MSVRITKISIEGFRAIRDPLALVLVDPRGEPLDRVVFAGPNGCGKTSVLEGILLALGQEALVARDLPASERNDHWRTELPPGSTIELEIIVDRRAHALIRTPERWELALSGKSGNALISTDPAGIRDWLHQSLRVEYFSSWRSPILPGGLQPTTRGPQPVDNESNRLRRLKQRIINERSRRSFRSQMTLLHDDERWLSRINEVWASFHDDGSTIDADVVHPQAGDPLF